MLDVRALLGHSWHQEFKTSILFLCFPPTRSFYKLKYWTNWICCHPTIFCRPEICLYMHGNLEFLTLLLRRVSISIYLNGPCFWIHYIPNESILQAIIVCIIYISRRNSNKYSRAGWLKLAVYYKLSPPIHVAHMELERVKMPSY